VGSRCGEGAQGDRREGDGGKTAKTRRLRRDGSGWVRRGLSSLVKVSGIRDSLVILPIAAM
jgi:hypothetical protein